MGMDQVPQIEIEELKKAFLKPYVASLNQELDKGKMLLSKTENAFQSYYKRLSRIDSKNELGKCINETNWLKQCLFEILDAEFPERREIPFAEEFKSYLISSQGFLQQYPLKLQVEQKEERFHIIESDSSRVKLIKPIKNFFFQLSVIPQRMANLFRKNKRSIPYWNHQIPMRSLLRKHFEIEFAKEGLQYFESLQKQKCASINLIMNIDKSIDQAFEEYLNSEEKSKEKYTEKIAGLAKQHKIEDLKSELDQKFEEWKLSSESILKKLFDDYQHNLERVGTFELDPNLYANTSLEEANTELNNQYNRIFQGWRNTFFAQIDDLQVDLELYMIKYCSLQQFQLLQFSCHTRIQKAINDKIAIIDKEFSGLSDKIKKEKEILSIASLLRKEKLAISERLDKNIIPQAIEAVYNQNIPELLSRLEFKIKEQINQMRTKRIIYSQTLYNGPISKRELSHFNPKELVEIDIFSKFSKINGNLKAKVNQSLELIQLNLNDLVGISDYNLDSAINAVEDNTGIDEVISISLTGIQRANSKASEVSKQLEEIEKTIDDTLKNSIHEFNESILSLTENENITQIRIKIAKAKALEKTEEYKRQILQNIKSFIPIALRFGREKGKLAIQKIEDLLKQAGLRENTHVLTAELSEFLSQTEKAIEKLPYVYKRLYQIKPLEDELFFEGRKAEFDQMQKAYENWKRGQISAICLHGEKGSGASSLINLFVKNLADQEHYRHKFDQAYCTEDDFIAFFQRLLKDSKLKDYDAILKSLCSGEKKIIILEDLQHFYLKKIKGFDALRMLLELISESSEHVFWLVEITSYTYSFLQKTVAIERYFRYPIELKKLDNQQIINLILKRHRVSGYHLQFNSFGLSPNERKKLRTMNEKNKQEYLKNSFFENLNQFAQSNISLALLYWLRSTESVSDNTIVMSQIQKLDFNFLNKLDNDSIFTLHSFLLHDSLSSAEHAEVFHQSIDLSRRTLMILEDQGLLNSNGDRYYLNRLLYRQVVNTLMNKNIIH